MKRRGKEGRNEERNEGREGKKRKETILKEGRSNLVDGSGVRSYEGYLAVRTDQTGLVVLLPDRRQVRTVFFGVDRVPAPRTTVGEDPQKVRVAVRQAVLYSVMSDIPGHMIQSVAIFQCKVFSTKSSVSSGYSRTNLSFSSDIPERKIRSVRIFQYKIPSPYRYSRTHYSVSSDIPVQIGHIIQPVPS
jgi:hypothetical protein